MERVNLNSAGERKKLIWAIGLGVVALIFLWWTFFGFGSGNPTPTRTAAVPSASSARPPLRNSQPQPQDPERIREDLLNQMQPITYDSVSPPATEARRNIFAFYEPPPPSIKVPATPTPTPTPTPPVLLAGVSPANVYARTSDFTLEATGDKFTAELRVTIDGRELPTRVTSPQQLTANVPAAVIANPGPRQVILRSSDGKLYSNALALNVSQPPTPNFTYVGILGTKHHVNDTAIVQDRGNREILNAKRGDVIGGRFRVTS
ncbi:MAG: hypothetical protein ACRD6N_17750, partial [Pyrinomonadaceae bacterium]